MTATRQFIATVAIALLGVAVQTAMAQEASPAPEIDNFMATKSRAEVRAETIRALQAGLIARNDADHIRLAMSTEKSTLSRVQVRAETIEAARLGLIPRNEYERNNTVPTEAQLLQITAAGQRAVMGQMAAR
jgi:Domain of unknown function (DUF4148)